jgi:glycosyltransferase involved in cell wall biosynthesis
MNILILNYEYPPLGGGAGVVSKYHAEGLTDLGHNVTVLTAWFKGEKEIEVIGNLKIIKLKSKRKFDFKSSPDEWISWIFKSKKFLSNYLINNKIDYCFAHFALPGGEVARYIYNKFKIPYSIISHGQDIPWFFPKQMFKYHLITYFWIKNICKKSDKLILLSKAMKINADKFMGKYKSKNIVIPNGCNTNYFVPDYSAKSKKFKIIFVGRLVEQKDPFTFLKSIVILKEKIGEDFIVDVLGNGPLYEKMKSFVSQNNLSDNVNFKGWVTKEEILKEYQSSHLQAISSKAEAMSIAALESLSCGMYLISTPVSGNTDIISDGINGEFFKFGDSFELSKRIINFYNNKFINNYKIESEFLENFQLKYSWKNIVLKLSESIN